MKILYVILLLILNIAFVNAENIDIKPNIKSGDYNYALEIILNTNKKDVKLFYYTDGEGRFDNLFEYKKPIILKEGGILNYFGVLSNNESTLVKENFYNIKYSNDINIYYENEKIIVKNHSGEIQNLGYWKIEGNIIKYEFFPYTYLDNNSEYTIDYKKNLNEDIFLISPDNKIQKKIIEKKETLQIDNKIEPNTKNEKKSNQESKKENINIQTENDYKEENIEKQKINQIVNNNEEVKNYIKTSIVDSNLDVQENNKNNYIFWFSIIFVSGTFLITCINLIIYFKKT